MRKKSNGKQLIEIIGKRKRKKSNGLIKQPKNNGSNKSCVAMSDMKEWAECYIKEVSKVLARPILDVYLKDMGIAEVLHRTFMYGS